MVLAGARQVGEQMAEMLGGQQMYRPIDRCAGQLAYQLAVRMVDGQAGCTFKNRVQTDWRMSKEQSGDLVGEQAVIVRMMD